MSFINGVGARPPQALLGLRGVMLRRNVSNVRARNAVNFDDTTTAYKAKKTTELLRHIIVLSMFSYEGITERAQKIVKFAQDMLGLKVFSKVMKMTVYGQFVAGEDIESIRPVIKRYRKSGVRSILDYSVEDDVPDSSVVLEKRRNTRNITLPSMDFENFPKFKPTVTSADVTVRASARTYFYDTEEKCDDVMRNFLSCVNMAADTADEGDTAFAAIKLTGLGQVDFLLKLSEVVEGSQRLFLALADSSDINTARITSKSFHDAINAKNTSLSLPDSEKLYKEIDTENKRSIGIYDWMNRFQPRNAVYNYFCGEQVFGPLAILDEDDLRQMHTVVQRAHTIAECAEERNVRLMIDAEQTYFQPAIRYIVVHFLMPKYNRGRPLIFNTIQCYLKNARQDLHTDVEYSTKSGFCYGVKLVRGAYLEQEREGALSKGTPLPIWNSKPETDQCYNDCVEYLIKAISRKNLQFMVATHNKKSVDNTIQLIDKYGVSKSDGSVVFGQLLGMCDHITFTLGNHGYVSYKYMPYGPVQDVIPYLIRRAHENKAMLEGADEERKLVRAELLRRFKNLLFHKNNN